MEYIPYGKQYIDQEDIDAVVEVLKSDWLTQGPKVQEFEELVAAYHNCKYAVSFSNGTAALHGAYYVSSKFPFGKSGRTVDGLNKFFSFKKPDYWELENIKSLYWEFITTPITFVASANGGIYCGGSPKFVDVDMNTYCIDIGKIEDQITEDTRVITPVSYAGYPVDVKAIKDLSKVKDNNICIIHDACHAIGARRYGHGIADYADMTILSFHPVKHITTGEGGMVLTNNKAFYEKLLLFRNHGITKDPSKFLNTPDGDWYYEMQELGYNYRITDIQCALGISQMKKLDQFLYKRNQVAKIYEEELKNIEWITLPPTFDKGWLDILEHQDSSYKPEYLHSYHLFPVRLDRKIDRKKFFNYMRASEIGVQVHYLQVNEQTIYSKISNREMKQSKQFYHSEVSLPIYFTLDSSHLSRVIETIKSFSI
jgi:UDP-4-amino-4,6-dideoxy-N-acetyl-beta-L-altrosamine transaminase